MGLLKWWKRELDISPSPKKPRKESTSFANKTQLTRNESYLKALTKFNKWRQMHLSIECENENKTIANFNNNNNKSENKLNTENGLANVDPSYASQVVYEEIDTNTNKLSSKTGTERNSSHSNGSDNAAEIIDDPEYAIPYGDTASIMSNNSINANFNCCVQSSGKVPVTDLDKSQGTASITASHECYDNQLDNSDEPTSLSLQILENISDLLICTLNEISTNEEESEFKTTTGYVQHGEIDDIEISYLRNTEHHNEANYYNLELLRKLRHPNIVLLMGISLNEHKELEALLFEPLKCSLYERIHTEKNCLPLSSCLNYALQIANSVVYMHKRDLVHTNICSQIIYICKSTGSLKLAGFELTTTTAQINAKNVLTSTKYRKQFIDHCYQAAELLTETEDYVKPTFKSDIYGICITLWEMLNCIVPYKQFTYAELARVFSLGKVELPIYEKERYLPFKVLLEHGLEMKPENRIADIITLKRALRQIKLNTNDDAVTKPRYVNQDDVTNTKFVNFKQYDMHTDRTSTIKRNTTNCSRIQQNMCESQQNLKDEPMYSPITRAANICWTMKHNSCDNAALNTPDERLNLNDCIVTPNKRYSINILIKSMCNSPNCIVQIENHSMDFNKCSHDVQKSESVKEKINKFETFFNASNLSNGFKDLAQAKDSELNFNINDDAKLEQKSILKNLQLHGKCK